MRVPDNNVSTKRPGDLIDGANGRSETKRCHCEDPELAEGDTAISGEAAESFLVPLVTHEIASVFVTPAV